MLEPLRDDSEGESLDFGHRLIAVLPVAQHAKQGRHFGQPAAISFALQLDGEGHQSTVYPQSAAQQAVAADGARWHPERAAAEPQALGAVRAALGAVRAAL